jgi:L-asparaginase II
VPGIGIVEEVRGSVVEARHRVHAVVVRTEDGELVASTGDPGYPTMLRSAAKPLQALAAARDGVLDRFGLADRHLSIACGSHDGTPLHTACVAELLELAGVPIGALRPRGLHAPLDAAAARRLALDGRLPSQLEHTCSGNHALFLAREALHGRDLDAYLEPDGPAQSEATSAVADVLGHALGDACDRCGMRAYAVPLHAAALAYGRLASGLMPEPWREAGVRIAAAMRAEPAMVAGERSFDTLALRLPGVVCKHGALGVFCCGSSLTGLAGAVKVEGGSSEAMVSAAADLLVAIGADPTPEILAFRDRAIVDGSGGIAGFWQTSIVLQSHLRHSGQK